MSRHDMSGDGFSEVVTEELPPKTHNLPPEGLKQGDELLQRINLDHAKLFKEAEDVAAAEARAPKDADGNLVIHATVIDGVSVSAEEWEKRFSDMVRKCQGVTKDLDAQREATLRPYRDAVSIAHTRFRELMDKLVDPDARTRASFKYRLEQALTKYKQAKERKEREAREAAAKLQREAEERARQEAAAREAAAREAQRQADEAAAAAARKRNAAAKAAAEQAASDAAAAAETARRAAAEAQERAAAEANARELADRDANAKAADLTRARGTASVSSLQEYVDFRDLNRELVDLEKLRPHLPGDAIEQAVRGYIKANNDTIKEEIRNNRQPLRGLVFWMNARTNVR